MVRSYTQDGSFRTIPKYSKAFPMMMEPYVVEKMKNVDDFLSELPP
jgi:hypothetical protein